MTECRRKYFPHRPGKYAGVWTAMNLMEKGPDLRGLLCVRKSSGFSGLRGLWEPERREHRLPTEAAQGRRT